MSRSEPRPEVLAFLRAIKEEPEDDAPRLILADWLEEHGDEHDAARAQLIRAQVEAARLPPFHPRRVELEGSARKLCQAHQSAWLGPLADTMRRAWYERGLLRVEAHMGRFVTQRTATLLGSEAYAWIDYILFPRLTPEVLGKLVSLPFLRSVTGLEVRPEWARGQRLSPVGSLFSSESVAGLRTVRLDNLPTLKDDVAQLAVSPHLTRLKALHIRGYNLNSAVTALAQSPRLAQLTELDFSGGNLGPHALGELAASPGMQGITTLNLRYNSVGDEGVASLASSPFCRSLTHLDLAGWHSVTGAGLAPLVSSPHLRELRVLDLSWIPVGQGGAEILAGSFQLSQLTELRLAGFGWSGHDRQTMSDSAVAILVRSPHLGQLTTLDLSRNQLGLQAAEALASSNLTQLTTLSLACNRLGYEGAVVLARSPILANVFFLDLSDNMIRRTGARALAQSPYLKPGVTLRLASNRLDAGDRAMLRERFGDRVEFSQPGSEQRD